jgi:hypothetical protein
MSYVSDLKSRLTPEQYAAFTKPLMYMAKEKFKGEIQDYQAQIITPLDTKKIGAPTQLEFAPLKTVTYGEGDGEHQSVTGGELRTSGVNPVYGDGGDSGVNPILGYDSTTPVTVNGLSVYAHYDPTGKLDYYAAEKPTYINSKTSIRGRWDAEGTPKPNVRTSQGGGFIKSVSSDLAGITEGLGPVWTAMKIAAPQLALIDVATDIGRSEVNLGTALNAYQGTLGTSPFTNPNAVGGVTGPDNIDVGGGFNPAAGATPAELAAAGGAVATPVYSPDLPVGTPLPPLTDPTLDEIIAELAPPTTVVPPIEVGPELLGEAGGNTFQLEPPLEGEIPLGDSIPSVSNPVYDYGDATPAEIESAKTAMAAKNITFKEALDYVRAGLFVNAITGDPLNLGGNTGGGGGGGTSTTGFDIVPVPSSWKSPTYAAPAAPIDINSLFTDMNLLGGTQWQGLATQKPNISFNDIFASGQQSTPMGTPVDINQIVSAILGQNTASQKPA